MHQVSVDVVRHGNGLTKRPRRILWDLFFGSGVARVFPIEFFLGNVAVVRLISSDPIDSELELPQVPVDAAHTFQVSFPGTRSKLSRVS